MSRNFQKARQPFVVQNGVLAESSRIFALAIGSLGYSSGRIARESLLARRGKPGCGGRIASGTLFAREGLRHNGGRIARESLLARRSKSRSGGRIAGGDLIRPH